jgi:nucleoid DNA-binding protein
MAQTTRQSSVTAAGLFEIESAKRTLFPMNRIALSRNQRKSLHFSAYQWIFRPKTAQNCVEHSCFFAGSSIVSSVRIEGDTMATQLSKSQLIERIATTTEMSKRDVKNVMDTLVDVGHKELKKNGLFLVPGFAKFVVVKKPATKARKGVNPFTGQEMMFKAKPARKIVRARPVKAAKDAV